MKKIFFIASFALAVAAVSCGGGKTTAASGASNDGKHFGAMIDEKGAIPVANLVEKMKGKTELADVKIEGKATSVCQAKGCWMKLESAGNPDMMVKFKDYAFFMPKDLAGKTVVCKGTAKRKTTSVAELRHYAEDAGKSAADIAKITEPKEEVVFEAAGVVIK